MMERMIPRSVVTAISEPIERATLLAIIAVAIATGALIVAMVAYHGR
jgi:hypothetical protein